MKVLLSEIIIAIFLSVEQDCSSSSFGPDAIVEAAGDMLAGTEWLIAGFTAAAECNTVPPFIRSAIIGFYYYITLNP
jgi:hypothetical protein